MAVGPTFGEDYPSAVLAGAAIDAPRATTVDATVFGDSIVRLVSPFGVEATADRGETWVALNVPRVEGARRVASDRSGNLWVVGPAAAIVSNDGVAWRRIALPSSRPGALPFYGELLSMRGEPWAHDRYQRLVTRLSATDPPEAWHRVAVPGVEHDTKFSLAAIGSTFVALGVDDRGVVSATFDGTKSKEEVVGARGAASISCAGTSCVGLVAGDIVDRHGLDGPWTRHDDLLGLAKWYVSHCDGSRLGKVASLIRRGKFHEGEDVLAFTLSNWGLAFDGRTAVVSLSAAENNGASYPFVLLLGPGGVGVASVGGSGLALLRTGEFWLFEVDDGIVPLTVHYE